MSSTSTQDSDNRGDRFFEQVDSARRQCEEAAERARRFDRQRAFPGQFDAGRPAADDIPGLEIVREIHRGGQGVVYEAIQQSTNRTVAVKVLHHGMFADPRAHPRFEREVQILGQFNHPNIVAIHDSGITGGAAYFVMDFVKGDPLDRYMASTDRAVRPVLRLFAKICDAVNAAHLRGVIHRDLKPGNILIDRGGEPHVLDFGLAKLSEQGGLAADRAAVVTTTGQFVGSLPWASPEQASGDHESVDTRTDVYALGVVLYQMLTGKFPYRVIGPMRDVLDAIMTVEPARPSTIRRQIGDEVETIILKCLSKSPERRYQTAGELSRDVRHYLNNQPIEAKRDSGWYILRKYVRRHRGAVATASAFLLLLLASAVVSTGLYLHADEQRRLATAAEHDAAQRARELKQVVGFQQSQLSEIEPPAMGINIRDNLLGQVRESLVRGGLDGQEIEQKLAALDRSLADVNFTSLALDALKSSVFERALAAIDTDFADQPLVKARLLQAVADTTRRLGLLEMAEAPQTEALSIRRRLLGDDHVDTMTSITRTGALLCTMGRLNEAETFLREALERCRDVLGNDHTDTLGAINNMGYLLQAQGRLAEAEPYYREALAGYRRVLGNEHPDTLTLISNMAFVLKPMGKYEEAEALCREALEGRRRVLGDDHPDTLASLNNLADLLQSMGKLEEAEPYLRDVVKGCRRLLGENHPHTLIAINNLGGLMRDLGRYDEADSLGAEAVRRAKATLPPGHWHIALFLIHHGRTLLAMERYADAETEFLEAYTILSEVFGEDDARTRGAMKTLADFYDSWDAAEPQAGHDADAAVWRGRLKATTDEPPADP